MRVCLLGTGAADGWPNPFCRCRSCAAERAAGRSRGQTAALIDGRLLLDCGPQTPAAASRFGVDLVSVTDLFITHGHPDHNGPEAALWRAWAKPTTPLRIHGPQSALDSWRPWIGPTDPVTLHPMAAGDLVEIDGYRIGALAAAHGPDALLFRVVHDGGSLLYATDTGPLPESTVAALQRARLDLLLLEQTFGPWTGHATDHLDAATFPEQLARLRAVAAIDDSTDVIAIHLSHHNPAEPELQRLLAGWSARAVPDGTLIEVAGSAGPAAPTVARPRRTLVLGGARSGKSVTAERLVAADPQVRYVATSGERTDDAEWQARVAEHRRRRPGHWETVESVDLVDLLDAATAGDTLLIDCLALWLTAVLDDGGVWEEPARADQVVANALDRLLIAWRGTAATVVAVSNEVGSGVVPASAAGRLFRDNLGRVNAAIAAQSEEVLLVTAGIARSLRSDDSVKGIL